jgi:serine/threonine protein kinase
MEQYTGKRLDGRYEIHEVIGVGGMAVVYRAYDTIEDRTVAVKILKDEYSQNAEFLRRFRNESKAIAVLSHPNIVKVYDVSIGDRIQYIVEEYIDGITLKEYLDQQKQIRWKEVIHFAIQILRALEHAHGKGIVHRDIKPQNIMLLQDGTIKVTDFGIARFAHSETRTMTDRAIGSVHYIAPEQARGGYTDEKTDIYSVGVMLYEMLTGQLPFEADNAVSVAIMQLQTDPKPPREINPSIPEGLEEITLRAMQKDPERRYQSAAEMLRDIEEFRRNPSARFEYNYFIDEKPTKYIDAIESVKSSGQSNYNDNYDYVEEMERVPEKKKKPVAIYVIAGIAIAFIIGAVALGISSLLKDKQNEPYDVTMPDYVGKMFNDVVNSASSDSQYAFTFTEEKKNDSTHPAGTIIDQTPKAGSVVKSNASVTLVVSTGVEPVVMPDVTDKTEEEATAELSAAGLKANVIKVIDDNVEKGHVVNTDPRAGQEVEKGSEVKVYVSSGKAEEEIEVPDVTGYPLQQAEAVIAAAGLTVGNKTYQDDENLPKDYVISTNPLNGVKLKKDGKVDLVLSSGKAPSKDVTIQLKLPQNDTRKLYVHAYIDGNLVYQSTVNAAASDFTPLKCSGFTGTKTLKVFLDEQENVSSHLYAEFSVNFTTGEYTQTKGYYDLPQPKPNSDNQPNPENGANP